MPSLQKGHTVPILGNGYVRLVDWMGTDTRIVEAARVSYLLPSKGEEKDKGLLFYLYRNKHTSPFEMCKITLDIKIPIFVMRQYIRHRMQNVNEYSLRYSEAKDEFFIPTKWRKQQDKGNKQGSVPAPEWDLPDNREGAFPTQNECFSRELEEHCKRSFELYESWLERGVAKEMARFCLPLNIHTYLYATWDIKNLLHFITLRDDSHAQAEIQEMGKAIKSILQVLFPWTMEAYERFKFNCIDLEEVRKLQPDAAG